MSLIKCPGCGHHISELETTCPSCDYQITDELVREIRQRQQEEPKTERRRARKYIGMTFFL